MTTSLAASFSYLTQTVNEINLTFQTSHGNLSADQAAAVMKESCTTLTRLLTDPDFKSLVSRASVKPRSIKDVLRDVATINEFIAVESQQLRSNGYSPLSITDILSQAIASPNATFADSSYAIAEAIFELKNRACSSTALATADRARSVRTGLYGVAIFVVDAALTPEGVTALIAAASFSVGFTNIAEGIAGL